MKNKSILLFVCLILMVFGFTTATAEGVETVTTFSVKTGTLLAEYVQVGQILNAAEIRIHSMPKGYGAFVLSLHDTDAVQSLFKTEQDGVYVQSGALGQQPLYFTWEELKTFFMEKMEAYAEMQAVDMPYDMGMMQSMMDGSLTDEQVMEMMSMDEEMLAYISDIQTKQVVQSGSFALEGSDAANQKTVMELTNEDLSRAMTLPVVREQMSEQLLIAYPEYSKAEIDQLVDEQLIMSKQLIEDSNVTVTSTVYSMDDEFIALKFTISADMDDYNGGSIPIGVSVTATKTTIESAKFYQMSVTLTDGDEEFLNQYGSLYLSDAFVSGHYMLYASPDEPLFEAILNCDRSQADHSTAELAFTLHEGNYSEEQSAFIVIDQRKAENVTDTAIDVYLGGSVDEIKTAFAETSLLSVNINTVVQPDSGFFTALKDATPETSVQLLKLREEELESYMQSMEQGLLMTLLNVIDNLPPEISDSLMQGMGGF